MKCKFLPDLRNKIVTCCTFSVKPTVPKSKNVKITMKKFDEEENEDFLSISTLRTLFLVKKKHFENNLRYIMYLLPN